MENMKKFILLGLILVTPEISFASKCDLPQGELLKIGCTNNCSFFYRLRLKTTAWAMGYKLSITDLSQYPNYLEKMDEMDGVLIPGGADIDPKYYLEKVTPELKAYTEKNLNLVKFSREGERRDPVEYSIVKHYSEENKFSTVPMLGICRGLQMMSVGQGIPLYLDIKTELGIKNRINRFDRVYTEEGDSLMSELYGKTTKGFKIHHQGIRVDYFHEHQNDFPNARVTAYSNQGKIAEAIEYTHRPAIGVQFHPEKSFTHNTAPIFRWFLDKACEHKSIQKKVTK